MLMDIKAHLLSLHQKGQKDEDEEYITSPAFRVSAVESFLHSVYLIAVTRRSYKTGLPLVSYPLI
jgi:hypothetical protein